MLELRPTCEHCSKKLPPNSTEAMICSYECTFCRSCVENVLDNICPNCGGNFTQRPIRPKELRVKGTSLLYHPATTKVVFRPVDLAKFESLKHQLKHIAPEER